ncbi:hypothetical protein PG985_010560 [Apiospora marii]|uniref:Uncharacterized protein n=1 Tax=Apiospora marii TaxID=335849 RepID=A0ABR1T1A2_9PEZI
MPVDEVVRDRYEATTCLICMYASLTPPPSAVTAMGTAARISSEASDDDRGGFYEVKHRLNNVAQDQLVAYESYMGAVLGGQFQLGAIVREESWDKRVYAVRPLMSPCWKLEATAFRLAGLPRKLLESRKRQLSRLKARSLCYIDQAGMKFIVHEPRHSAKLPSSAQSHKAGFVLDPSEFPMLEQREGFATPLSTTGDLWARIAAHMIQSPTSNDVPDIAALDFPGNMSDGTTTEDTQLHLTGVNQQFRQRPKRKRRHGKSKVPLERPPTNGEVAPEPDYELILRILASRCVSEQALVDNYKLIPDALATLTTSADSITRSRIVAVRWLAAAAKVEGTVTDLLLLQLEAQAKRAECNLTLGAACLKNTVSKIDYIMDRYLNLLKADLNAGNIEGGIPGQSRGPWYV